MDWLAATPLKKTTSSQQPLIVKALWESVGAFLMSPSATQTEMLVSLSSNRSCPACDYNFCEFECNSHIRTQKTAFSSTPPMPWLLSSVPSSVLLAGLSVCARPCCKYLIYNLPLCGNLCKNHYLLQKRFASQSWKQHQPMAVSTNKKAIWH